jgi:beta-glucosidase
MDDLSVFPDGFTWGVATSAYQIEGAVAEDGRSPSIWDTFSHTPGKVAGGDTGDTACDSYHRWPEDLGLMKELGVGAYRFSIAWPRVVPGGRGPVNQAGLDHYDRLVDALLAAGITPYPTLYHWDLPQTLQDKGGWAARDTAAALADYATVVASRLGDRATNWVTVNEPRCAAWIGHLEGRHAPGLADIDVAVPASFHLLLGHGLAAQAVRAAAPGARVGLVNVLHTCEPASGRAEDIAATARFDGHVNRWWLDPIHGRGFPADMQRVYGVDLPERPGDLATIATPLDFLGANYYSPTVIADHPGGPVPYAREVPPAAGPDGGPDSVPRTMLGWEIRAAGLEQVLVRLSEEYGAREVYVTENGSAWPDQPGPDGRLHDSGRVRYLEEHLAACGRAVRRGVPLAGYFAWSLLDNFEWDYGYEARFGLVYVDYPTQQRLMKDSGRRYADIIAAHRQHAEQPVSPAT